MVELGHHPGGIILSVKALPGARTNALRGEQDGALKVAVTQVAEKGKANKAIITLLAECLALKKSQIELLSGPTSGTKQFLIRGVCREELAERIRAACEGRQT